MGIYAPNYFPADRLQFTAGAAITAGQLLFLSAANTASPTTAATAAWLGVAEHDVASGDPVPSYLVGVHTLAAAAAVAAGVPVKAAAAGGVAAWVTGTDDASLIVGLSLAAAAGNLVPVLIR
jgi:hypothetical protein